MVCKGLLSHIRKQYASVERIVEYVEDRSVISKNFASAKYKLEDGEDHSII